MEKKQVSKAAHEWPVVLSFAFPREIIVKEMVVMMRWRPWWASILSSNLFFEKSKVKLGSRRLYGLNHVTYCLIYETIPIYGFIVTILQ